MIRVLDKMDMSHIYEMLKPVAVNGSNAFPPDDFPEIYNTLDKIGKDLGFQYNIIQINRNHQCQPHKDAPAINPSQVFSCGEYTGGELVIEGVEYDTLNQPVSFDGADLTHWNNPIVGDKIAVLYWTKV
jgi:hypothetical protein